MSIVSTSDSLPALLVLMAIIFAPLRVGTAQTDEVRFKKFTTGLSQITFSPDGKRVAISTNETQDPFTKRFLPGQIKIWDIAKKEELLSITLESGGVSCVAYAPDGKRLAGGVGCELVIWDAELGKSILSFKAHDRVFSVAFSPDGKRIVSGGEDGEIKVWAATSGLEIFSLEGPKGFISSIAFSPDGKRFATVGFDKLVRIWDADNGKLLLELMGHEGILRRVEFRPDGNYVISSGDGVVNIWDANTGRLVLAHKGLSQASYSPDGKLVAGYFRGEVMLWDLVNRKKIVSHDDHVGPIFFVVFSPDGSRVAVAGEYPNQATRIRWLILDKVK